MTDKTYELIERLSDAARHAEDLSIGDGPFHRLYVSIGGIAVRSHLGNLSVEHRVSFAELDRCVINPIIQVIDHNAAELRRSVEGNPK